MPPQVEQASGNGDFWPAVTDVMTVILMLFMLAMVALVVNNSTILDQMADATKENTKLQAQIDTQKELMQSQTQRLKTLQNQIAITEENLAQSIGEANQLEEKVSGLQANYRLLELSNEGLEDERQNLEKIAREQESQLAKERSHNLFLKQEVEKSQETSKTWQEKYETMKKRYDKLIRPARTAKGKRVAEISYRKDYRGMQLSLKKPGHKYAKPVTQRTLERELRRLQAKDPKSLYLKIIFPKGGNVSHNEAWKFTHRLLRRFDYYYQETP